MKHYRPSQVALAVKNPPGKAEHRETQFQSLGLEDPLEEDMQPTPVLLPGGPCEQRSLAAAVHRVAKSGR